MSDKYRTAILKLLPQGLAWAKSIASNFYKLIDALSAEPQRVDDTVAALLRESNILDSSDTEVLAHWESMLGITDIAPTTAGRRGAIQAQLLGFADPHSQFSLATFQGIAAGFGYTFTVTRYKPFYMGVGAMGDPLGDTNLNSILTLTMSTSTPDAAFEAAMQRQLPNHVEIHFVYP